MSGGLYQKLIRPALFKIDPERIHHIAMAGLRGLAAAPWHPRVEPGPPREVFGVRFPNPIGLAAGFDKNALVLPAWEKLGFGFIEAGTITAKGQPGNPKPRIFRLPKQQGLINRMGFNNDGAEAVAERLAQLRVSGRWPSVPLGINIGKTKVTPLEEAPADYLFSFEKLFPYADYFVLNVSSPNTPGLRTLQGAEALDQLLCAVQKRNRELSPAARLRPVLLKIAPDLEFSQIEEIIGLVEQHGIAGMVATNTTLDHGSVPEALRQQGGLSGAPLRQRSTEIVRFICGRTSRPVIGVGGISDVDSAMEKFDAGAALVQLYTGFIYEGPGLIRAIAAATRKREL
ncbi:MAG TPA: quinone-dependent dihydroorotate dehydrogenase [Chthoniobacteraceae bacterium]|jgi:dihydroorotate dehydrogenase|nr:quinone-dependent dihydroorotate dehydrogenase [Chthoniobacteraceae bacterium]